MPIVLEEVRSPKITLEPVEPTRPRISLEPVEATGVPFTGGVKPSPHVSQNWIGAGLKETLNQLIQHPFRTPFEAGARYPRALFRNLEELQLGKESLGLKEAAVPPLGVARLFRGALAPTEPDKRTATEISWDMYNRINKPSAVKVTLPLIGDIPWEAVKMLPFTTAGKLAEFQLDPAIALTFGGIGKVLKNPHVAKFMARDIPAPKWLDDTISGIIKGFHRPLGTLADAAKENRINAVADEVYTKFEPRMEEVRARYRQAYGAEPTESDLKGLIKAKLVKSGIYDESLLGLQATLMKAQKIRPLKPVATAEPTPAPPRPAFTGRPTEYPPALIAKNPLIQAGGYQATLKAIAPSTPKIILEEVKEPVVKAEAPLAGGMTRGRKIPEQITKWLEKGVSITERQAPIRITDPEAQIKDISGKMVDLPKGHEMIPYKLSNGKIWLHDGKDVVVESGQLQNLANKNLVLKGYESFAPELEQVEEVVKGEVGKEADRNAIAQEMYGSNYNELTAEMQRDVITELNITGTQMEAEGLQSPKFSQYQLPGGENYREVLLKIPTPELAKKIAISEKTGQWDYSKLHEGTFKSPHWDEPNILAHIRMNDRTTPDGKKILFIEELQSDWAKEGRAKGFQKKVSEAEENKIRQENVDARKGVFDFAKKEPLGNDSIGADVQAVMQSQPGSYDISPKFAEAVERYKIAVKALDEILPYKTSSHPLLKNWQELALKRAIKEAVDGGYDYISWTTGEQQAERYDLSKQVDMIQAKKEVGGYYIQAKRGTTVPIDKTVHDNQLEGFVGKDLAKKIREKAVEHKWTKFEGEDLTVGGEWAKNLYDKQIPNILKDLTKEEAEQIKLPEIIKTDILSTGEKGGTFQEVPELNQLALKITPEIKAKVMGAPMAGGEVPPPKGITADYDYIKENLTKDMIPTFFEDEQKFIRLRYENNMSLESTAKELGISLEGAQEYEKDIARRMRFDEETRAKATGEEYTPMQEEIDREVASQKQQLRGYLSGKLKPELKDKGEYADLKHLNWLFAKEGERGWTPDELYTEINEMMGFSMNSDDEFRQLIKDYFAEDITKGAAKTVARLEKQARAKLGIKRGRPFVTKQKPLERQAQLKTPSFGKVGKEWKPEQAKSLYNQAVDKGLIYIDLKGKKHNKLQGILRYYKDASYEDLRDYISELTGMPTNPPLIFKLYGDIKKDTEVMKFLNGISWKWQDINDLEVHTLDPPRIIEKVTGQDLWDGNMLADNTFYVLDSADSLMFDRKAKEIEELERAKEGIQQGSRESEKLMRKFETKELLSPKEQRVADYLRRKYNEWILEANQSRGRLGYPPIPFRKDYMTHILERNLLSEFFKGDEKRMENISNAQLEAIRNNDYTKGNMPFNRFAQQRLGWRAKYDAIGNYEKYLNTILREIYYTPAIVHARKFIKFVLLRQPNAYKALDRLLNDVKGKPSIVDNSIFGVVFGWAPVKFMRKQIAKSALLGNINFWAINLSNFTTSSGELGSYFIDGVNKFLGSKEWRDLAFKNSVMLKGRKIDPDLDPSTFNKLEDAVGFITSLIEYNNVGSTWVGAYRKGVNEFNYPHAKAVRYADAIARRTQVGYKKYELPAWMRSNTGQILSQFQTWTFNAANHIIYDMRMANVAGNLTWRGGRPKFLPWTEEEKKPRWAAFWRLLITALIVNELYKKAGLRKPYETEAAIPRVPGVSITEMETPTSKFVRNIKKAFTGKEPETRKKAAIRAAFTLVPGGTQIGRFITGTVFPQKKEKKEEKRFTGRPIY